MFKGLEHTAIASPNPRKLANWYKDILDFRINFKYAGNYFVRASNGSMLEIIPSEGERNPEKMKIPASGTWQSRWTTSMPPMPSSRLRVSISSANLSKPKVTAWSSSPTAMATSFT